MEEILVQIACRLDKELFKTVDSLLVNADNPNKIEILIINQDFENDSWSQSDFPKNVTLINIEESKTRNLAQTRAFCRLYVKPCHKYFLNIDAHSRFDPGWDSLLINAHKEYTEHTGNKCMITVYPKGYKVSETGEDILGHDSSVAFNRLAPVGDNYFRVEAVPLLNPDLNNFKDRFPSSIVAGGFHFTSIDWVFDVGYDIFCGWVEHELNITLRTYCHGYDIVSYYIRPIFHLYDWTQRKSTKNPSFEYEIDSKARLISQLKEKNLTFLEDKFPIGSVRTVEEFEKYFNFELRKQLNII